MGFLDIDFYLFHLKEIQFYKQILFSVYFTDYPEGYYSRLTKFNRIYLLRRDNREKVKSSYQICILKYRSCFLSLIMKSVRDDELNESHLFGDLLTVCSGRCEEDSRLFDGDTREPKQPRTQFNNRPNRNKYIQ